MTGASCLEGRPRAPAELADGHVRSMHQGTADFADPHPDDSAAGRWKGPKTLRCAAKGRACAVRGGGLSQFEVGEFEARCDDARDQRPDVAGGRGRLPRASWDQYLQFVAGGALRAD